MKSLERLDLEDVRAFQVHLVAGGMSRPALNQTVCALRFLYGVTLGRPDLPERIPHAREPQKLPVVLGADEVVRFLEESWTRRPYWTPSASSGSRITLSTYSTWSPCRLITHFGPWRATPHLSYVSESLYRTFYSDSVRNILDWLTHERY